MPTETTIIVGGIVVMFALFAVPLMWASAFTRDVRVPGASYFDEAKSNPARSVGPARRLTAACRVGSRAFHLRRKEPA